VQKTSPSGLVFLWAEQTGNSRHFQKKKLLALIEQAFQYIFTLKSFFHRR